VSPVTEARQAAEARQQVAALYQAHALGLVKLAVLMVGDQLTAEDVVQDAFLGLYRRWPALTDHDKALSYVRASVLNGCRMFHRGRYRRGRVPPEDSGHAESAAAAAVTALAVSLATLHPARHAPAAPAAPAVSSALPEYYAALDDPSGPITQLLPGQRQTPVRVLVGDDRTGKLIATVNPPKGETFAGLTAAADDRTFVVAAEQFPLKPVYPSASPVAWYLVRLAPGRAHPATLTRLPIPGEPPGTQVPRWVPRTRRPD